MIKIRLQSQVGLDKAMLKYKGPIDAAVQTVRNEVRVVLFVGCGEIGWGWPSYLKSSTT